MEYRLNQDQIEIIKDKDLQLRYILGGIQPNDDTIFPRYWGCYLQGSGFVAITAPVEEDKRLLMVKQFLEKHNIDNESFLQLTMTYLCNGFRTYKGDFGNFIPELCYAISGYCFPTSDELYYEDFDLLEKELLTFLNDNMNDDDSTRLNEFLMKYSLTPVDFLILAKNTINRNWLKVAFPNGKFIEELREILNENNLCMTSDAVKKHKKHIKRPRKF